MSLTLSGDIIGLDLGISRTGVARINTVAKIAEPLTEINMQKNDFIEELKNLVIKYDGCAVVAGLPRGLDGQETEQTVWARELIKKIEVNVEVPVFGIDEAGTTKLAEQRAQKNESVDSVAAGIILEDFISEVERGHIQDVSI